MCISEGRVCHQQTRLGACPLCEFLWTQPLEQLACTFRCMSDMGFRNGRFTDYRGLRFSCDLWIAIHDHIGQIGQQLGSSVAARSELEQLRCFIEKGSRCLA